MDLKEFDYELPESLIAAYPSRAREAARLLVLYRQTGEVIHSVFAEIGEFLNPGDLLVLNDTKVFPARLRGTKASGGQVEVLLLEPFSEAGRNFWIALIDAAKKPPLGSELRFGAQMSAEVIGDLGRGRFGLEFHHDGDFDTQLERLGEPPLPPYVRRGREAEALDRDRYQTVYAVHAGAVAAPTAGFHFTPELFTKLAARGIERALLTLHVGPGTFQPVRESEIENHRMEGERYSLSTEAAAKINRAKQARHRVVAVGSTSTRTLEWIALKKGEVVADEGIARLYIRPGDRFPRAGRVGHQFSSARLDTADTGRCVCRLGSHPSRLSRSYREKISILQLRRRDADTLRRQQVPDSFSNRATRFMNGHFTILKKDVASNARLGHLITTHGEVETPCFMPVGTQGTVKAMLPRDLRDLGCQILLGNTYHLYLRPGHEVIRALGGLHRFMGWDGPILTDSGGYQVFSLGAMRKISEEGAQFQSHLDGSSHLLTPEKAVEIQEALGSDIAMTLDECIPSDAAREYVRASTARTIRWAQRCAAARTRRDQLMFGIIQGGLFEDLRRVLCRRDGAAAIRRFCRRRIGRRRRRRAAQCDRQLYRRLVARRSAALFDGRRPAARHHQRRTRRFRYVRLRDSDPQCAQRHALHFERQAEHQARRVRRRPAAVGRRLRLLLLPQFFARLFASPVHGR